MSAILNNHKKLTNEELEFLANNRTTEPLVRVIADLELRVRKLEEAVITGEYTIEAEPLEIEKSVESSNVTVFNKVINHYDAKIVAEGVENYITTQDDVLLSPVFADFDELEAWVEANHDHYLDQTAETFEEFWETE